MGLADALVFARYERSDTQFAMFDGAPADETQDKQCWAGGLAVFLAPSVVLKFDVTRVTDDAGSEPAWLVNAGVGFAFPR